MASYAQPRIQVLRHICLVGIATLLLAGFCFGQAAVTLSPKDGPPTTKLQVSGSGFTPYSQIDIYFDTQDEALAVANGAGKFSQIAIQAPASAGSSDHWVSAVERAGQHGAQKPFTVHVNWTEFMTKDMERWNPYENVLNVNNVGSLKMLGSYWTGSDVTSSLAVVNGVAYSNCWQSPCAVSVRTGALLWSYPTGSDLDSSPAVANGVVYVGGGGGSNNVYALNASTGALLWSNPTGYNESAPAVANGVVYFGSDNGPVYALDATTGDLLWSYTTGGYVYSAPAVANGVVYVGSMDNNLYALNASTGALLWSYTTGGGVFSSPAVANGVVYVGSYDYNLYAFGLPRGLEPQPPKRPALKTLHPDFNLKVSQPVATPARAD